MRRVELPQGRCLAGVSRCDVTPPVGIYHRMWGAATHDRSTGIHRPLTATVLYLQNPNGNTAAGDTKIVVALDHCLLGSVEMEQLLQHLAETVDVPHESLIVFFSHTHGAGLMELERQSLPGGDLIPTYLLDLSRKVAKQIQQARKSVQPATMAFGVARCDLAKNRHYLDEARGEYVCGFNPTGQTDDTVVVVRVADKQDRPIATIVNYACHPTTLAWENMLISPDFIGAMRETVETTTEVPCLFIQGAAGDLGPRDGFVGDVAVADRNGRQLGYAVLSALESMPNAGTSYVYEGSVISGATLGIWKYVPTTSDRDQELCSWRTHESVVSLRYRDGLPKAAQLVEQRDKWEREETEARAAGDASRARDARAMVERMTRGLSWVQHLPPGDSYPFTVRLWKIGDSVWVALNGEHYNLLQRQLRSRFPNVPIVVGTLANGSGISYLLDNDSYGKGLYQENVSILAQGSLETLIDTVSKALRDMGC